MKPIDIFTDWLAKGEHLCEEGDLEKILYLGTMTDKGELCWELGHTNDGIFTIFKYRTSPKGSYVCLKEYQFTTQGEIEKMLNRQRSEYYRQELGFVN